MGDTVSGESWRGEPGTAAPRCMNFWRGDCGITAAGGGANVPMAAGGAGRRTTVAPGLKPLATLTGGADGAAAGGAADVAVAAAWWWFGGAAKLMGAGGWTAGCAGCCGDGVHAGAGCGQAAGLWVAALCDGGTGDA